MEDLPIEIIQHIQSFLDGGEAARTCLLSKSWYDAWSTRPILVFKFDNYHAEFQNYVTETMKRYKQFNLKLETLVLISCSGYYYGAHEGYRCPIDELLADASSMGITKLYLHKIFSHHILVNVLAIKSLTKLSVNACNCKELFENLDSKVLCPSLVSLRLPDLRDRVIKDILLGCPLIENLELEYSPTYRAPRLRSSTSRRRNSDDAEWNSDVVLCPRLRSLTLTLLPIDSYSDDYSIQSTLSRGGVLNDYLIRNILLRSRFLENLEFKGEEQDCIFPSEVFALRSLTKLSIISCQVRINKDQRVLCSHLKSLCVSHANIIEDGVIQHILSECPLLENLDMEMERLCSGQSNINVSKMHNLAALRISYSSDANYVGEFSSFPQVSFGYINVHEFHKLRCLVLQKVILDKDFFTNFSSRFSHLENLTLNHCAGYGEMQISSQSLKYFQLHNSRGVCGQELEKAEFDVPNIRKFVFYAHCDHIPSLSFHNVPREWESKIELWCSRKIIGNSWFVKLREFLNELSLSRISLTVNSGGEGIIMVKDLPFSSTPVVDILKVNSGRRSRAVTHDLLCALFRCCRPTFIRTRRLDSYGYSCAKLLHELFIINQNIANYAECLNKTESLLMYDLAEIDLEILKGSEWQTIPWTEFFEDEDLVSECLNAKIRFRLKWGAFRCIS